MSYNLPDENGHFDQYGGIFVAETLMSAVTELNEAYEKYKDDPEFLKEFEYDLKHYVGRETPLYYAENLTKKIGGAKIYLKREDLNHTGAHKVNNTIGQALLAKRMGKTRIIAETGAGQHGVASATIAARLGLECVVYMGEVDVVRQVQNVYRMKLLGATVVPVSSGSKTLKDALNEAMRDWVTNIDDTYYIIGTVGADKKKVVADLKKSAKTAEKIFLATDEDREGEAIAWHLQQALSLDLDTPRIVFHEITKGAITAAIKNPRTINTDLVDAQQARRIIDRLVGFEISPVLWRKISGARSAGRVQSPVVRLVVEREREISAHTPISTFKVKANLANKNNQNLEVKLSKEFSSKEDALSFAEALLEADLIVDLVDTKPSKRSPKAPFITSTLQQEASQKLGFSVKQTMSIAQNLYREGAITYMRTDSLNLSEVAITAAQEEIVSKYGKQFHQARRYKTSSSGAQEAHEAIRPTDLTKPTILGLDDQSSKLYSLIYKRTLASQMSDAQLQKTKVTINISGRSEHFIADGEVLSFAGFLEVYDYMSSDDKLLPEISKSDMLTLIDMNSRESFSRAKPRYTEASLVKEIEQMGIGRPSTFATMITTVQDRNYVVKDTRDGIQREYQCVEISEGNISELTQTETTGAEKNKLFPTNVAYLLVDFLLKNFRNIIGYEFTANLESDFDLIAEESKSWTGVVRNFYEPFHEQIELAKDISRDETHGKRELGEDPVSGKPVSVRFGRYGAFARVKRSVTTVVYAPELLGSYIAGVESSETCNSAVGTSLGSGTSVISFEELLVTS